MRILTISNCPLSESQSSGYVILNFCRGLRERGHEVELFGPESFEPWPFLRGKAKSYRQALGMLFLVRRQLHRRKYDVVELYGAQSWLAMSYLSKRPRDFLLACHSNGLETRYSQVETAFWGQKTSDGAARKWYQLDQNALFSRAFRGADGIVTVCAQDVPWALKQGYQDAAHLVAIDNALPSEFLGLEVDFHGPRRVIGFCGSWLPRKGIAAITGGMILVLRAHPEWRLHLIGVGAEFEAANHFPDDVAPRVDVTPRVEDKAELQKLYQQMAILLMPSIFESFGLVAAEGMACGCALLATETGFAARLKHGEEAWIIAQSRSQELADGVNFLIENEVRRVEIARNGYRKVQNLHWKGAVAQLEATYQRWLNEIRNRATDKVG